MYNTRRNIVVRLLVTISEKVQIALKLGLDHRSILVQFYEKVFNVVESL